MTSSISADFPQQLLNWDQNGRVVNGFDPHGPLPYQLYINLISVSMLATADSDQCGATLIAPSFAISAMHCFGGEVDLEKTEVVAYMYKRDDLLKDDLVIREQT